uniref:Uncharacterized protein n=1 Tax=Aegilops tauschii subsp. strangulata TaxID=200361 RepID=A0A453SS44_AEGTS
SSALSAWSGDARWRASTTHIGAEGAARVANKWTDGRDAAPRARRGGEMKGARVGGWPKGNHRVSAASTNRRSGQACLHGACGGVGPLRKSGGWGGGRPCPCPCPSPVLLCAWLLKARTTCDSSWQGRRDLGSVLYMGGVTSTRLTIQAQEHVRNH